MMLHLPSDAGFENVLTQEYTTNPLKNLHIYFWKPLDCNSGYLSPTASINLLGYHSVIEVCLEYDVWYMRANI